MPPELTDLTEQITLTPYQAIGIPIALIGAVFLSLGAQLQHRGVARVEQSHGDGTKAGLSVRQLLHLAARPSWLFGTVLLGLAILFQLTSLGFAPLIVVQPLGVVALVITAIVNARVSRIRLEGPAIRAIVMCVGGVGVFVAITAVYAIEREISERQLLTVQRAQIEIVKGTHDELPRRIQCNGRKARKPSRRPRMSTPTYMKKAP